MHTSDLTKVIEPRTKSIPKAKCCALLGKLRTLGAIKTDTLRGDRGEFFTVYFLPSTRSAYVIHTIKDEVGRKRSSISGPYTSVSQLKGPLLPITFRS